MIYECGNDLHFMKELSFDVIVENKLHLLGIVNDIK